MLWPNQCYSEVCYGEVCVCVYIGICLQIDALWCVLYFEIFMYTRTCVYFAQKKYDRNLYYEAQLLFKFDKQKDITIN